MIQRKNIEQEEKIQGKFIRNSSTKWHYISRAIKIFIFLNPIWGNSSQESHLKEEKIIILGSGSLLP